MPDETCIIKVLRFYTNCTFKMVNQQMFYEIQWIIVHLKWSFGIALPYTPQNFVLNGALFRYGGNENGLN